MTRRDYIEFLDRLRRQVLEIEDEFVRAKFGATVAETDRRTKTGKMMDALADRLFEDSAVSTKIKADMDARGEPEQGELFDNAEGGEE